MEFFLIEPAISLFMFLKIECIVSRWRLVFKIKNQKFMNKQTFFKKLSIDQFRNTVDFYKVLVYSYEPNTQRLFILIQANEKGDLKGYQAQEVDKYPTNEEVQEYVATAAKLSRGEVHDIFYAHLIMLKALQDFQG